ncbi:MAG: protein kinase [Mariniblastus sp.]
MTIDTNQFWNLLTESKLVNVSQVQSLFTEFSSAPEPKEKDPLSLAKWLIKKKAISRYHAQILVAGHSGPFTYGNYSVWDRIETVTNKGHFVAQHSKTGHRVLLQFAEGTDSEHLDQWRRIENSAEILSAVQHPNIHETFEAVVLKTHRFVVSQMPTGTPMTEKLPRKTRVPWKKACMFAAQIANGLKRIHATGESFQSLTTRPLSPNSIFLEKSGLVRIHLNLIPNEGSETESAELLATCNAPEFASRETPPNSDASADTYSLGCSLYRMVSGRDLPQGKTPNLSKFELPAELDSLILKMIDQDPTNRPSVSETANLLGLLSGKSAELNSLKAPVTKSLQDYRNSVRQFLPGTESIVVGTVPEIGDDPTGAPSIVERSEERQAKIDAAAAAAMNRKNGRWKIPAAIAAGLLAMAGGIGLFALRANRTVVAVKDEEPKTTVSQTDTTQPPVKKVNLNDQIAALPPELRPTLVQNLVDDNQTSLWESPTQGVPCDFSYLPPNPKLLFTFRLAQLDSNEEGQRLLRSLGPEFEKRINQFKTQSGLEFENIESLTISLHTNESFEYEPFFTVETTQPIEADLLTGYWNRPRSKRLENQEEILESNDGSLAYYILERAADKNPNVENADSATEAEPSDSQQENSTKVSRFAFGPKQLIEQVVLSAGTNVLGGPMKKMALWTDNQRHMNILFLRPGLFNEEGQKLMGQDNLALNRELGVMLPDEVKGGLVSLHLDSGSYFEMMFDRTLDLKAVDLQQELADSFKSKRDSLAQFASTIPPSPYWDRVRSRYYSMLSQFYRYLRWNVEHGEIVANCWLPPMAAHNLIASSELVISFAGGASTANVPAQTSGPKTIEELLALKRDLNIANPPDLNVLMADLQSEISDDFGRLPFAFNIRLIGGDLEKDGITKNQRPGELVMEQKSLSEILTKIMTEANPDKDITGPSDPNCKLIWVLADDPENPGQKAILVTTRAAAALKSYELPPPFRTE